MFDLDFSEDNIKVVVFDAETTVQRRDKAIDGSPFNPDNKLVSGHWLTLEVDPDEYLGLKAKLERPKFVTSSIWYHLECDSPDGKEDLQAALDNADLLVAHNAKFDVEWLTESGFRLPDRVWCTMIGEYIFARGQNLDLSLAGSAKRRGVTHKKGDLIDKLFKKEKKGFEAIPMDILLEYAEADVISCAELFLAQLMMLHHKENIGLIPTFDLMNDMLFFVSEIEANGIKIDLEALDEVEEQFTTEKNAIQTRLKEIVETVMGDTPINLNSGVDLSKVIYSREVIDKNLHKEVFNLGTDHRGKPFYPPRMSETLFAKSVKRTTRVIERTQAMRCGDCRGRGSFYKIKKNGDRYKNPSACPVCAGEGVVYQPTGQRGGLRLIPKMPSDACVHGFCSDKHTIKRLIAQATDKGNDLAVEFLSKLTRLNAVSSYLSSFVDGIRFWVQPNGILHPNFNQTIVATGRLSSSKPNFQNQPKGKVFPVRKCVVSRFKGGEILEADYSGLEFRVAGELSRDEQIISDILNGKDIHRQTGSIIFRMEEDKVSGDMRQSSKPYTFAPLYGGMGASEPEHIQAYFKEFFNIYSGHGAWQRLMCDTVLKTGVVTIPSGRQYRFHGVKRLGGGRVTNQTNIVNYPVQGFATGDIVPLACIRALREFRRLGLRSLLILTVHDSIVVDVYPGEREQVVQALLWAMEEIADEMKTRWNYTPILPLATEMEAGPTWMHMEPLEMAEAA